ncbi:Cloroperoxidase [Hortaea werneckii]|uniref:Heme haloperoxidase family profile domain-containing protein n=1 Tax=Hortaea werneckii TaxID=91943 RepID=A0A3M7D392_HORWE|nr:Cloroperoxidase [Hortaea werneckii]KAI7712863.1 Cloroperoxidase [Hortaea werneckii]RMY58778.1 hypothetical protein D0865_02430 [Hortaea werneckii]
MLTKGALATLFAAQASAFPWVLDTIGQPRDYFGRQERRQAMPGSAATCPNNPNHKGAVPISAKYPYCGAKNGLPGFQVCVNNLVPAKGDTAHYYTPPGPNDIRGPCPGINTAANHNFVSHDGITTFEELVDMQQNVYGVGYDLSVLLAVLGVGLDGDPISGKLSIGCDASSRTTSPGLPGPELGLDGHNKFEGDTSLTRNDYFLANGDNFSFNQTKYKRMSDVCKGSFDRKCMTDYRYERYQESVAWNGNFYFGPKSLLLFGAASFLYELFPSLGELGKPDQTTMDYFFKKEQLPPNWYSRVDPYTIPDVAIEIFAQYQGHPVAFGGNTGKPNSFVGIGEFGPSISGNMFKGDAAGVACLLYQVATENAPSALGGGSTVPPQSLQFAASKLNPLFGNSTSKLGSFGCPLNYNSA